jgi:hypothetical protein
MIRTVKEFDSVFPINSRLYLLKLALVISDCEQYEIRPRVGTEKTKHTENHAKRVRYNRCDDIELIHLKHRWRIRLLGPCSPIVQLYRRSTATCNKW